MSIQDRRRSASQAVAGGALFGAGAGGSELLNRRLKAKGQVGPYKATYRTVTGKPGGLSGAHVPHVAGKLVTRGAQAVGLPLAAYGVYNAVRPQPKKTRKLRVKQDIVAPVVHHAVLADQVQAGQDALDELKKALTESEKRKLSAHRSVGRTTSLVGGTLGLAALGARAPGGAKLLSRAGVKSGKLVRIAAKEPHATAISNTLGVGAIGTGAAGSFNYAAQQKLERKREPVAKGVPSGLVKVAAKDGSGYAYERLAAHKAGRRVFGVREFAATGHGPAAFPRRIDEDISRGVRARRRSQLVLKADERKHPVSGSAIASVGGVAATLGAVGGGLPGFKSTIRSAEEMHGKTRVQRAGAKASASRGGIFGYRTDAHRGYTAREEAVNAREAAKPGNRAVSFHRGVNEGKIAPEHQIITHMKRGKRASGLLLAGGLAASAYGVHRAKGSAVAKAEHPADKTNATLAAGGALTAGVAHGAAHGMERLGRGWAKRAKEGYDAAGRIVPAAGGHRVAPSHPKIAPNPRVPNIRPAQTDPRVANTALKGRSKSLAAEVGRLRGAAHQHAYFGNTYGGQALIARKVRGPALGVAAVGAAGLALSHRKELEARAKAAVGKAALPAKPTQLPKPPPTKAETKAKEGDREFYRHHKTNRFTTKWMGAQEFSDEAGTAETEMKNLSASEGKPAEHAHWRRQLRAASEYHRTREEHDLADEIDEHLSASTQRHRAKCAESGVKQDIRKDAFLRGYRERISPEAERGYKTLKEGRNQRIGQAGGGATMAALGGWLTHHELHQPKVAKPAAAIAAAGALASAAGAASQARSAHRYSQKMGAIKAKARSRRAQGLYGPGRGKEPVDMTSARARNLAKAMSGGAW